MGTRPQHEETTVKLPSPTALSTALAAVIVLVAPHAAAQNKAEVIHWWTSGG